MSSVRVGAYRDTPPLPAELSGPHIACRGQDAELFFAPDGEHAAARMYREKAAKRICRGCPVRNICLDWATEARVVGVWAGTNEIERGMRAAKADRRVAA